MPQSCRMATEFYKNLQNINLLPHVYGEEEMCFVFLLNFCVTVQQWISLIHILKRIHHIPYLRAWNAYEKEFLQNLNCNWLFSGQMIIWTSPKPSSISKYNWRRRWVNPEDNGLKFQMKCFCDENILSILSFFDTMNMI